MDEIMELYLPPAANSELADPTLLTFYRDLEERVYWLNGEITEDTLELARFILQWNREDKKNNVKVEDRKPIKIIFASNGGSADVGETLSTFIKMSKTPVYGIAVAMVASAASIIYLSCHKKFAIESAYYILHKGSCSGINGNYDEVSAFMDDYKKQVSKMIDFYTENTKYTAEEVNQNIKSDWYVRFPEALEKGLTDELITDIDFLV